jgi:TrmH RNA methyltransferase
MRNRFTDELAVCGLNTIRALSEVHPEKINRLFMREDRLPLFTGLCKGLAERKRPYKLCEDEELEKICKTPHHQGIVAMIYEPVIKGAEPEDMEAWTAKRKTGLLLCDIGNDLNLGAIVRSAAFFDASPVVLAGQSGENENEKQLSTGAYRSAEGGMEYVEFLSVRNPALFLKSASKNLVTMGADPRARIRIRDIPKILKEQKTPGVVLVIGNEEKGLSADIKEQCSILARIPGTGAIESLNAAQAATLFLQELYEC